MCRQPHQRLQEFYRTAEDEQARRGLNLPSPLSGSHYPVPRATAAGHVRALVTAMSSWVSWYIYSLYGR